MTVKQKDLTDVKKTENGASVGSTGEVVDALTNNFLIKKQRESLLEKANREAKIESLKRKIMNEGSVNTK